MEMTSKDQEPKLQGRLYDHTKTLKVVVWSLSGEVRNLSSVNVPDLLKEQDTSMSLRVGSVLLWPSQNILEQE